MGVSTNAILFYGVHFEEGTEFPWDEGDDNDVDGWYAEKMGVPRPEGEYNEKAYDKYRDERRPLLDKMGVEVGSHCSDKCPMPYISVRGTEVLACRGYPEEIDPKKLVQPSPKQIQALKDFLELAGLEWEEPKWWLVSYWG